MALDDMRLAGLAAGRFDDIGVDSALRQKVHILELGGLFIKQLYEQAADDLALGLWVGHTGQLREIAIGRIHADDAHAQVLRKDAHHVIAFVVTQQTVIDKHAGQLIAYGAVQQCCHDR